MSNKLGLLLMTYGSPSHKKDVPEYLRNVRGGKEPSGELIDEFQRRYEVIGGSPLNKITETQAQATADSLQNKLPDHDVKPYVGMHYWKPTIRDAVERMTNDGVDFGIGIIMSPQYSSILMEGYFNDLEEALVRVSDAPKIRVVKEWWQNEWYHRVVANKIEKALREYPESIRDEVSLLLTAHSIPKRVDEKNPDYVKKLKKTANQIMEHVERDNWNFAYQSAGHTKEEWLKPDMTDLFPGLVADGRENVLIAPFQFLADHLEILYDIDVAAKQQAEEAGLNFKRIESLNDSPLFIQSLTDVALTTFRDENPMSRTLTAS